jgi:BNR/Asp-box repeat
MRIRSLLIIILSAVGLICPTSGALADWGPPKRLTWTSGGSYSPAVAAYANAVVHAVWYDSTPYNYEIYYKRSTDGGTTWGGTQRLTWNSGVSAAPAIAVDSGGSVQVVWSDNTPGNYEIYGKRSTDGGSTWSAAKRLTWTSGESGTPAMAIDSNNAVHVVWYNDTAGVSEIYYMRSTDGGTTWSAAKRLTWTSGSSGAPAIAPGSGNVLFIVWEDYTPGNQEIYGKKKHGWRDDLERGSEAHLDIHQILLAGRRLGFGERRPCGLGGFHGRQRGDLS